jgi:hypothetical protein
MPINLSHLRMWPTSTPGRLLAALVRWFSNMRSFSLSIVGTWEAEDPAYSRPIAAPLERCAELLGVDLATIREAAATVQWRAGRPGRCPSCHE